MKTYYDIKPFMYLEYTRNDSVQFLFLLIAVILMVLVLFLFKNKPRQATVINNTIPPKPLTTSIEPDVNLSFHEFMEQQVKAIFLRHGVVDRKNVLLSELNFKMQNGAYDEALKAVFGQMVEQINDIKYNKHSTSVALDKKYLSVLQRLESAFNQNNNEF